MKRNTKLWGRYITTRWSAWLQSHEPTISVTRLARELADEGVDKDKQPRAMIYGWRDGSRVPRPTSVWRAGEALRRLGWDDCCVLSLYAAGFHAKTILVLAHLASTPEGAFAAGALACALPIAAEVTIERQLARKVDAKSVLDKTIRFVEISDLARALCINQCAKVAQLLRKTWPDNAGGPEKLPDGLDVSIRAAFLLAAHETDPVQARGLSWPYLVDWAKRHHDGFPAWEKYHSLFDPLYVEEWTDEAHMAIATEWPRYFARLHNRKLKDYIQASLAQEGDKTK